MSYIPCPPSLPEILATLRALQDEWARERGVGAAELRKRTRQAATRARQWAQCSARDGGYWAPLWSERAESLVVVEIGLEVLR